MNHELKLTECLNLSAEYATWMDFCNSPKLDYYLLAMEYINWGMS